MSRFRVKNDGALPTVQLNTTASANAASTDPTMPSVENEFSTFSLETGPDNCGVGWYCPTIDWPVRSCEATIVYRNFSRNFSLSALSILAATAAEYCLLKDRIGGGGVILSVGMLAGCLRKRCFTMGRPDGANGVGLGGNEGLGDLEEVLSDAVLSTGAHSGSEPSPPSLR